MILDLSDIMGDEVNIRCVVQRKGSDAYERVFELTMDSPQGGNDFVYLTEKQLIKIIKEYIKPSSNSKRFIMEDA